MVSPNKLKLELKLGRLDCIRLVMTGNEIIWREPEVFASGDTLFFQKNLPECLPTDGWAVRLTVTKPPAPGTEGAAIRVAEVVSVADATGHFHVFNVPNFLGGLDSGGYVLSESVFNAAGIPVQNVLPGTRWQIYHDGNFTIGDDLADGVATGPQLTFVQRMIPLLEAKIARLEAYDLTETDVQRTRFVIEDKNKSYERYWRLLEFRNYERKQERAANTGRDQNYIRPVFTGGW